MKRYALVSIACLLAVAQDSNAATVNVFISPAESTVTLGSSFDVEIRGSYGGPASLAGGAVNLTFDKNVLNVVSVLVNPAVGDFVAENGTIDNANGSVEVIGFASFIGIAGDFKLATVSLQAVGLGTSPLQLSDPNDPVFPWTNYDFSVSPSGDTVTPQFSHGSVTAVPLPAGAWLFLTGLLGLRPYCRGAHNQRIRRST
jgi:hypothetical protein